MRRYRVLRRRDRADQHGRLEYERLQRGLAEAGRSWDRSPATWARAVYGFERTDSYRRGIEADCEWIYSARDRAGRSDFLTPCVASAEHGDSLLFKLESCQPSGSYKDRFAAAEVERLAALGVKRVVATSSGNTGSALAAYCARAGMQCAVVVNADAPTGKLAQMRAHGARVLRVRGFTVDAAVTERVFEVLRGLGISLVVSAFRYCPEAMAAVSSVARELISFEPAHVFVPVGGGGLYTAVARGIGSVRVHAVQPEGCATVVDAWRASESTARVVQSTTRISGLSVPNDIDATLALSTLYANGGEGVAVSDDEVFAAQRLMLSREGIYCEPAGAAAYAGWLKLRPEGRSVCLVTGHGFKDPDSIAAIPFDDSLVDADGVGRWFANA
ncbi:MAG: pyridoxal-phosphate dependent enzyme [Acidobacteria bacterium]|nr:pyridoxal-phosphate dependent enzyme [Acidobacteriota bacterium]